MSKPKLLTVIDKRIKIADDDGRKLEKDLQKGNLNMKQFLD